LQLWTIHNQISQTGCEKATGIMSHLGYNSKKQLQPNISIEILKDWDVAAAESSDAWNNAGTGHSAFVN
jgi:L-2-hydroxyglutarate oxidase LhgO